jgi:hypothetical protein
VKLRGHLRTHGDKHTARRWEVQECLLPDRSMVEVQRWGGEFGWAESACVQPPVDPRSRGVAVVGNSKKGARCLQVRAVRPGDGAG